MSMTSGQCSVVPRWQFTFLRKYIKISKVCLYHNQQLNLSCWFKFVFIIQSGGYITLVLGLFLIVFPCRVSRSPWFFVSLVFFSFIILTQEKFKPCFGFLNHNNYLIACVCPQPQNLFLPFWFFVHFLFGFCQLWVFIINNLGVKVILPLVVIVAMQIYGCFYK